MRFTVDKLTPEATAEMFLCGHYANDKERQEALAEILKLYWQSGYDAALSEAEAADCAPSRPKATGRNRYWARLE